MQGPVAAHTLAQTKQRMFDLMVTPGISCRMLFYFAPVAVRRLFMSDQEVSSSPPQVRAAPRAPTRNNGLAICLTVCAAAHMSSAHSGVPVKVPGHKASPPRRSRVT